MSRYIAIFSPLPAQTLGLARSLSPRVEVHPSGGILLETPDRYEQSAIDRMFQNHVAGGRVDFAAASTRTAALLAARQRPGSSVPKGGEAEFLSPFPVSLLALHDSLAEPSGALQTLERWGVRTLGQLAALPREELISRLGQIGLRLQRLARGEDLLPFQPQAETVRFEAGLELEWEIDNLEPLTFVLGGLLEQVCRRLEQRGLATDQLRVALRLEDGVSHERAVSLAFPMRDPKTLLSLLRLKLQSEAPGKPIRAVSVQARPARPQTLQGSLLEPASPHPEKLSRTLARLTALTGEERVGSPRPLDTHRPDAFALEPFSPPRPAARRRNGRPEAKKEVPRIDDPPRSNRPAPLTLKRLRPPLSTPLRTDQIVACAGPWRVSGQWWETAAGQDAPAGWSRDEWDVEFADGRICRVFWEPRQKKWFLEGIYD